MSLKNHHCAFSFEIPRETGHTHFRWDTYQDVYMIWHHIPFYDFYTFPDVYKRQARIPSVEEQQQSL